MERSPELHIDDELRRVRNTFLDENKRYKHEWTKREKGMIHLDWFRNPELYYEWTPSETDDLLYIHRTTLMFGYSHLSITNLPNIPFFCKFLPITIPHSHNGFWQAALTLELSNQSETCIHLHLLRKPSGLFDVSNNSQNKPSQSRHENQVLTSPRYSNFKSSIPLEVSNCAISGFTLKNELDHNFPRFIIASLSTSQLQVYDISQFIRNQFASLTNDFKALMNIPSFSFLHELEFCLEPPDFQPLLNLKIIDIISLSISTSLGSIAVPSSSKISLPKFHLGDDKRFRTQARKTEIDENQLCFAYTRFHSSFKVLPTHLALLLRNENKESPSGEIIVFDVTKYITTGENVQNCQDIVMRGIFPPECYPTSISSIPGTYEETKESYLPIFITSDEGGYIRVWKINDKSGRCHCAHRLDSRPLTSISVNQKIPSLVAYGTESGFIRFYDISKLIPFLQKLSSNPPLMPLPPPSSGNLYDFQNHSHPVSKLNWISGTFITAQYSEPYFNKESTNGGVFAIWDPSKQSIYDDTDIILQSKYWTIQRGPPNEQEDYLHSWASLIALHGGHINSSDGVLTGDFTFSAKSGLLGISVDESGQLHFFKPNLFFYSDCDDYLSYIIYSQNSDGLDSTTLDDDDKTKLTASDKFYPYNDRKATLRGTNLNKISRSDKYRNSDDTPTMSWKQQFKISPHKQKIIEKAKIERMISANLQIENEATKISKDEDTLIVFQESKSLNL